MINRIGKKVSKNNSKKLKKTRKSSKTGISDFKLECAKMFLMEFLSIIQIIGENSKPFWSMLSGRVTKIHPSLTA